MKKSAMHYKMYKAKKNWVSAGLVTTAVLAGLTLGSVKGNEVVAHADTTPAVTQQQTNDAIADQQQKVNDANDAANKADQLRDNAKADWDKKTTHQSNLDQAAAKADQERDNAKTDWDKKTTHQSNLDQAAAKADQERDNAKDAWNKTITHQSNLDQAAAKADQERDNAKADWDKKTTHQSNLDQAAAKADQERDNAKADWDKKATHKNNLDQAAADAKTLADNAYDAWMKAIDHQANIEKLQNELPDQIAQAQADAATKRQRNFDVQKVRNDVTDVLNQLRNSSDTPANIQNHMYEAVMDANNVRDLPIYGSMPNVLTTVMDWASNPSDTAKKAAAVQQVLALLNHTNSDGVADGLDAAFSDAQNADTAADNHVTDLQNKLTQANNDHAVAVQAADAAAQLYTDRNNAAAHAQAAADNYHDADVAGQVFNDRDNAAINAHKLADAEQAKLDALKAAAGNNDDDSKSGDTSDTTGDESEETTLDTNKDAASTMTREAYRAQLATKNNVQKNTLPQTGSENTAAVAAMGAVAAMLGLGLAAKKREF